MLEYRLDENYSGSQSLIPTSKSLGMLRVSWMPSFKFAGNVILCIIVTVQSQKLHGPCLEKKDKSLASRLDL